MREVTQNTYQPKWHWLTSLPKVSELHLTRVGFTSNVASNALVDSLVIILGVFDHEGAIVQQAEAALIRDLHSVAAKVKRVQNSQEVKNNLRFTLIRR